MSPAFLQENTVSDTNDEGLKAVGREVIKALRERNPRALLTPDVQELSKS